MIALTFLGIVISLFCKSSRNYPLCISKNIFEEITLKNLLKIRSGETSAADLILPVGTLMEAPTVSPQKEYTDLQQERLSYSIHEAAALLGVNYFSVYRLIQRGKLRACRALRGKLLVPRSELLRLLKS